MFKEYLEKLFGSSRADATTAEVANTVQSMRLFSILMGNCMGPQLSGTAQLLVDAPQHISASVNKLFLDDDCLLHPNIDVDIIMDKYSAMGFDHTQIFELFLGTVQQLNVSRYADPRYDVDDMSRIHRDLQREAEAHLRNIHDYFSPAIDIPTKIINPLENISSMYREKSEVYPEPPYDEEDMEFDESEL